MCAHLQIVSSDAEREEPNGRDKNTTATKHIFQSATSLSMNETASTSDSCLTSQSLLPDLHTVLQWAHQAECEGNGRRSATQLSREFPA